MTAPHPHETRPALIARLNRAGGRVLAVETAVIDVEGSETDRAGLRAFARHL